MSYSYNGWITAYLFLPTQGPMYPYHYIEHGADFYVFFGGTRYLICIVPTGSPYEKVQLAAEGDLDNQFEIFGYNICAHGFIPDHSKWSVNTITEAAEIPFVLLDYTKETFKWKEFPSLFSTESWKKMKGRLSNYEFFFTDTLGVKHPS